MLGILYIILSWLLGYNIIKFFLDKWINRSMGRSMRKSSAKLPKWMITLSSSFLVGMLFSTWFTYVVTWIINRLVPEIPNPLFIGNVISYIVFSFVLLIFLYKSDGRFFLQIQKLLKNSNGYTRSILRNSRFEIVYVITLIIIWTTFIFRSLNVKDNILNIGISVFSDFGATLPIVRSFSLGSNFPTVYPHFAETMNGVNNIRYHFLFQFMSGNLEYLGLRIDWAFNLPSIISVVAFIMLLYSFVVIVSGKRAVGVLTTILFFFRSSFAYFTYLSGLKLKGISGIKSVLNEIINININIGNTPHEDWGFWAQKVYMNKRHFSFALGITIFVLILLFPTFRAMIRKLKSLKFTGQTNENHINAELELINPILENNQVEDYVVQEQEISKCKHFVNEVIFSKSAWLSESIARPVIAGILLGMIGFWNGATVISALPVLFVIALLSKHRLEYLYAAIIALVLIFIQTRFFMGNATGVTSEIYFGFISPDRSILGVMKYYFELFGLLPIILMFSCFYGFKGRRWLLLSFIMPLIIATNFKFSVDVGANHVIIIFSVMLLCLVAADFLWELYETRNMVASIVLLYTLMFAFVVAAYLFKFENQIFGVIIGILLVLLVGIVVVMISNLKKVLYENIRRGVSVATLVICIIFLTNTGVVDLFTLYNMDKNVGTQYNLEDQLIKWAVEKTNSDDVFLIKPSFTHKVLMAGRRVYLGGAYFCYTAGYNFDERNEIVKKIFEASNSEDTKRLIADNKIKYIVIENELRSSQDYKLNEKFFEQNYEKVYSDISNLIVYKVH